MLIQLKESEIKVALQDYIVAQGINLAGKTVDISFTAGRKESGISADLDILDATPVGSAAVASLTQALTPRTSEVAEAYLEHARGTVLTQGETSGAAVASVAVGTEPADDEEEPAEPAPTAAASTTSSLFGG